MVRSIGLLAMGAALSLTACGGGDEGNLAALDAQLTNGAADPALTGALADEIAVDPTLRNQSNANAIRPPEQPASGGVPVLKGDAKAAAAQAQKIAGGKLLRAPAAVELKPCAGCANERPVTLGALAREQGKRQSRVAGCEARLDYGMQWAQRLPEPFTLYPGAQLLEAAGAEGRACAVRAVSFRTSVPMQSVLDFYYTQARRAGYDAEHALMNGDHVLGGVRSGDDAAYFISFAAAPGGGTSVDIVANKGR